MSVMIVTSVGEIVVDLYTDKCPLTTKNFLKLCKIKYYNGCLFHTVKKDFTAQTGDPTGTGSGGDSIYKFLYGDQARFFGNEIHLDLKHSKRGTVAMASAGEDLNASQFYITLRDDLDYLDGTDTVFGEVAEGLETLDRINEAFVDDNSRPLKNIRIKHTYVLDDPFDDPPQLAELVPDASPEGKPKDEVDDVVRLEDDWVPMDEQLAPDEVEEVLRAQKAKSSALVLESIGDIPDAEIKPPDNVLFVCKLNPVTEDGDLHTIFSRFGTVTSAEIIRDFKTGDSLCYAFIEFEDKEACEQAYFKMDNALIDDRRIHVDFSQSVAKLWSQYRRKNTQKGGGCFKCGSPDHLARDCTGSPSAKQQPAKYILKDDTRNGGDDNSRYQMVFDEDTGGSPDRSKRRRRNELDDHSEKRRTNREGLDEFKGREYRNRDSSNRQRDDDRNKEYRRDDRHRSQRKSPSGGQRKEYSRRDDHDIRRSTGGDRYAGRRDDRDHRRSTDSSSHRDRADDGRHDNEDESHSIKVRVDDDGRRSRGERDHVNSNRNSDHDRDCADDGSHDDRDESHRRKARLDDDGHRSRGERDHARHSTKSDSGRHHDRERRH